MKKSHLFILAALAVAVIALFFLFTNPMGRLIKLAIEEFGPKMTQADVRVNNISISATDGQGIISGMLLGNPKGFKTEYALKAGKIEMDIDPASIAQDVVVIHKVLIDTPQIIYEKGGHGTNFDAIQHNVEQYLGVDGNKKGDKGANKKIIIGSLIIHHAKVNYNGTVDLILPDIELHNIGKKAGGATSAQVVKTIINELAAQMALAISKAVAGSVGSAVKELLGK